MGYEAVFHFVRRMDVALISTHFSHLCKSFLSLVFNFFLFVSFACKKKKRKKNPLKVVTLKVEFLNFPFDLKTLPQSCRWTRAVVAPEAVPAPV